MSKTIGILAFGLFSSLAAIAQSQPPRNQFRTTVLVGNLQSPTQIAFRPDGRLYLLLKDGNIKLVDPKTNATSTAIKLAVSNVREDGLDSIALDPAFAENNRVYLLFGTLQPSPAIVVARFTDMASGALDPASRKDLLSVPYTLTASDEHATGCLAFGPEGNLYIGLADNTENFFSGATAGFSPRDPKRPNYDAQRSAANSMGLRHPFRLTVDAATGWLHWAEPGPNAAADEANKGPRGYDQVSLAKTPGYYGWPYCTADNFCYHEWNYETGTGGPVYSPTALRNTSANNTGIQDLPAARPALIWYPYDATGTAFPIFGIGSVNTSMLGPVYRFDAANPSPNKITKYYNHHLFIFDFSRTLIHGVDLNDTGGVAAVKRFWDQTTENPVKNPIDMKLGPDGAFYFLDWADNGSYHENAGHGNLVRLEYTGPIDPVALGPAAPAAPEMPRSPLPGAGWDSTGTWPFPPGRKRPRHSI